MKDRDNHAIALNIYGLVVKNATKAEISSLLNYNQTVICWHSLGECQQVNKFYYLVKTICSRAGVDMSSDASIQKFMDEKAHSSIKCELENHDIRKITRRISVLLDDSLERCKSVRGAKRLLADAVQQLKPNDFLVAELLDINIKQILKYMDDKR